MKVNVIVIGIVVLIGALIGYGLFSGTIVWQPAASDTNEKSKHGETAKSLDEREFLEQMIPHHQEAIDSSRVYVEAGTNEELKQFASRVVEVQTTEVNQMKQWYGQWYDTPYQPDASYMKMMPDMKSSQNQVLDIAYIQGMIDHHNGAIGMAQAVLKANPRIEIRQVATTIIKMQSEEVDFLQDLLAKYGVSPAPENTTH